MSNETKKPFESVGVFLTNEVTDYRIRAEWVLKSDFDRVVEELTNQIELEREKALRFAEWAYRHYWKNSGSQWEDESGKCFTTSELYASKEFEDYLNGLKK